MGTGREMSREEMLFRSIPLIVMRLDKLIWYRGGSYANSFREDVIEDLDFLVRQVTRLKNCIQGQDDGKPE